MSIAVAPAFRGDGAVLSSTGCFGPNWHGHPFRDPAYRGDVRYREPDLTRAFAGAMQGSAGSRAQSRARTFLETLLSLAGESGVREHLDRAQGPIKVSAEHPIDRARQPRPDQVGRSHGRRRIDLLFTWPLVGGTRAVVVVEAKLDAIVAAGQLVAYRAEAKRLAAGGPHALVLLTVAPDRAEVRNQHWRAVRWRPFLARWEVALAAASDDGEAFRAARAQAWRACLARRGTHNALA